MLYDALIRVFLPLHLAQIINWMEINRPKRCACGFWLVHPRHFHAYILTFRAMTKHPSWREACKCYQTVLGLPSRTAYYYEYGFRSRIFSSSIPVLFLYDSQHTFLWLATFSKRTNRKKILRPKNRCDALSLSTSFQLWYSSSFLRIYWQLR